MVKNRMFQHCTAKKHKKRERYKANRKERMANHIRKSSGKWTTVLEVRKFSI